MDKWISVKFALPATNERGISGFVLTYDIHGFITCRLMKMYKNRKYIWQGIFGTWNESSENITHWMELPSSPNQEKTNER